MGYLMALPSWVQYVTNIRGLPGLEGPRGLPGMPGVDGAPGLTGTLADVQVTMIAAGQPGRVEMFGPETARGARFFLPEAIPSPTAVENDTAVSAYVGTPTSKTRRKLDSVTQTPLGVPIEDFLLDGETFDYTGTTGMSTIIQRALDTVSSAIRPVQITFKEGRIRIDARLIIVQNRKGIGIRGAGKYRTTFDIDPTVLGLLTGYGDSNANPQTYLENVHVSDMTVDCSRQVADPNTSLKAFNIGHLFNSSFQRIRVLNSWATAFGCDFLTNVDFVDCDVYNAGRGLHSETVLGSGSSYGIGVGAWPNESVRFINCRSFNAGRMGWNLEWLSDYSVTDFQTKVSIIGCLSDGDSVGIGDLGTKGIHVTGGTVIQRFKNAGIVIGTGGQAPRGGRGGCIDGSTVIRQGVKGGRPDQDVYGGHGIVIRGDDSAGGYTIDARIEDNAGDGINFEPGFRLSAGGLDVGAKIRRNGGVGVRMAGAGEICLGVSFVGMVLEDNAEIGLDLRSSFRGLVVSRNKFFGYGKQNTAIRFDPFMTLDAPRIDKNDAFGHSTFMTGEGGALSPVISDNRRLSSLAAAADPNLVYFRTMKTQGNLTGIGTGWAGVVAGSFTEAGSWGRSSAGLQPVTSGTYNGATLWAYDAGQTGTVTSAVYDPPSTGTGWRGVAISVNPSTGEAVVFRAGGDQYFQVVRYTTDGGNPVVLWSGSINPVPGSEKHQMGLYRPAGGNLAYALIDGVAVWSGSVAAVPETSRVGVYAVSQGAGVLYNFAIRKPAVAGVPVSDIPLGLTYYSSMIATPTATGLGDGWAAVNGGSFTQTHTWQRTATGATPVTGTGQAGGTTQYRTAMVGQKVVATYATDSSSIGVRGIAVSINPTTGDMVVFRAAPGTNDYEVRRYVGTTSTLFFRTGNATPPVNLPAGVELGLQRDAGTTTFRAFINGTQVWSGSIASVPETPNVGVTANASNIGYLTKFGIYE